MITALCFWLAGILFTVGVLAALGLWRGWGLCPWRRRARFAAGLALGWPVVLGSLMGVANLWQR